MEPYQESNAPFIRGVNKGWVYGVRVLIDTSRARSMDKVAAYIMNYFPPKCERLTRIPNEMLAARG